MSYVRQGMTTVIYLIISLMLLVSSGCHLSAEEIQPVDAPDPVLFPPTAIQQFYVLHINIIQQGSRLFVVIPTDLYFNPYEQTIHTDLLPTIRRLAREIACFANMYPGSTVFVRAYTEAGYNQKKQLALSIQYANVMSAFLWNAGISMIRINARGFDGENPIGNPQTVLGRGFNRRIEIQIN